MHIASCDCVVSADDSALYYCCVGSFLFRSLCWLLERVQRLRISYRSVELYPVVLKVDVVVVGRVASFVQRGLVVG